MKIKNMFKWLSRPTIASVKADQLYEAQRAHIDALAAVDTAVNNVVRAKSGVTLAQAYVTYLESRIRQLDADVTAVQEPTRPPRRAPIGLAGVALHKLDGKAAT